MSFANKVVLVTGGSSGIGAAIAIAFAKEGANVIVVGRNEAKLKNVAEDCEKIGMKPHVIIADITYENQVEAMIKESIQKFGKLDILVNNAGRLSLGSLMDGSMLQAYDEVMKINMRAQVHVTSEVVKYLVESKGNIVNISSVGAFIVPQDTAFSSYCISKTALNQFTKCAAVELSQHGVRVNAVCPGPTQSDIMENAGSEIPFEAFASKTLLGKISRAEEVADVVLFLASNKAQSITGATYNIDNGYVLKN